MTSLNIDFYFINLLSKALLHYICNSTGLHEETLYIA